MAGLACGLGLWLSNLLAGVLQDAHRRIMIANHPDSGGSSYIAAKVGHGSVMLTFACGKDSTRHTKMIIMHNSLANAYSAAWTICCCNHR
jgi:hypothetical protein